MEHRSDHLLTEITTDDLRDCLAWLRTDYQPHRFGQKPHLLSAKTLRNIWVTFSAFFNWASSEFKIPNSVREVPAPRFQVAPVEPFTKEEVEKLLEACLYTREAKTGLRRAFVMRPPHALRNQTLVLVLLGTSHQYSVGELPYGPQLSPRNNRSIVIYEQLASNKLFCE